MRGAVRCPKCHWVYWSNYLENWGTCDKCGTNNDFNKEVESPRLVDSKFIFTYLHTIKKFKAKVVCLLGAPGSGKSTLASKLFAECKSRGMKIELSSEYMKRKIWEEDSGALNDQFFVFANQYHEQKCVAQKADYVISDGPLITEILYNNFEEPIKSQLNSLVRSLSDQFDNYYYLIKRDFAFEEFGRLQTKEECDSLHDKLKKILDEEKINYKEISAKDYSLIINDII